MIKRSAVFVLGALLSVGGPHGVRAADLDELSKYLAFIEGFQYLFEFCQAEAKLPSDQISFAAQHIRERRALIFAGLDEAQRDRISADAQPKKKQVLAGVMDYMKKNGHDKPLKEQCKEGFFAGIVESEKKGEVKEVAAIQKAKN